MDEMVGKMIVVRSNMSGVWLGKLKKYYLPSVGGGLGVVVLTEARRAWEWKGAASCSGLATRGPSDGKICEPVQQAVVFDVCEYETAEDKAVTRWKEIEPWIA